MSFTLAAKVWAVRGLSAPAKMVLMRMADFADDTGNGIFASVGRIADDCELSDRTVQRAIADLIECRVISLVELESPGAKRAREYRIHVDALTGDSLSGVTERQGCHSDRGDRETGEGCQKVTPRGDTVSPTTNQYNQSSNQPDSPPYSPPPPDQSGIGADEARLSDLPLALAAEAPEVARQAFDAWNDLAREIGLPIAQAFTARRQSALKARLAEVGGLEGWGIALAKIRGSPFLRGETSRDGWKADLDFLLQQKSFTKLMEGSYDRLASRKPPTNSQQAAHEARSAAFRRVADQLRRDDDVP